MQTWQLQKAKAHLSKIIRLCTQQGPQIFTVRGRGLEIINPFE